MGFPTIWVEWIKECISTPFFSVMVNEFPSGLFYNSRGLQQQEPLSVTICHYYGILVPSNRVIILLWLYLNFKEGYKLGLTYTFSAGDT